MPLWLLAERRLKATMSAKERCERLGRAGAREGGRVEAVEGLQAHALGGGDDARSRGRGSISSRTMAPVVQHVGDRVVGQRGGEQERAVDRACPRDSPRCCR